MFDHRFLFHPGDWEGEGEIRFSLTDNALNYKTSWHVHALADGVILATQKVFIAGGGDVVINRLRVSEISKEKFLVGLENPLLGSAMGSGVINEKTLAWEYRGKNIGFEGYEVYERGDDEYLVKAEYASADDSRTMIKGKVWLTEASS